MIEDKKPSMLSDLVLCCERVGGECFGSEYIPEADESKVLLISHELTLTGAPIVLFNLAQSLLNRGYHPVVICPTDGPLKDSFLDKHIPVVVCEKLLRDEEKLLELSASFDFVIVNTFSLVSVVATFFGTDIPVLWWVHELLYIYYDPALLQLLANQLSEWQSSNIMICTIGSYASDMFLQVFPNYHIDELPFWLPDGTTTPSKKATLLPPSAEGKRVFAQVGTIENLRGQDVFLDAIEVLPSDVFEQSFFVFVGKSQNEAFRERICAKVAEFPEHFCYIPQIPREQMPELYRSIDCLVCASRNEAMSAVVVEACQFKKAIICSEGAGVVPYLNEHDAALIYHNNDSAELASCLAQLSQADANVRFAEMQERARDVYEQHFTAKSFDQRFFDELLSNLLPSPEKLSGATPREQELNERLVAAEKLLRQIEVQRNEKQAELTKIFAARERVAMVYPDAGEGYSEDTVMRKSYDVTKLSEPLSFTFELPNNCRMLRFDPVDNYACAVQILQAKTDLGPVELHCCNGTSIGNVDVFPTIDPQYEVAFDEPAHVFTVTVAISIFDNITLAEGLAEAQRQAQEQAQRQADELAQQASKHHLFKRWK